MTEHSLAERKCTRQKRDFKELFRAQFVLSRDAGRTYPGWEKTSLHGWTLHHGTALIVRPVLDSTGYKCGLLLGHAWKPGGTLVKDALLLTEAVTSPQFANCVDREITDLGGRYLAVVLTPNLSRVYGDPVYDLPMLYDSTEQKLASSLGLVLDRDIEPDPDVNIRAVLSGRENISFQRSLDRKVRRAVANHYLDLTDFSLHRHWPSPDMPLDLPPSEISAASAEIAAGLAANIAALSARHDCVLPVTGGRDSRTLLAAALPAAQQIRQFVCHRFHNPSRKDAKAAQRILASVDLPLTQYFKQPHSHTLLKEMRLKMGWSGFRGELAALPMIHDYPRDHLILRGNNLELLRATQWRRDKIGQPLHMKHAIRRLGVSASLGPRKAIRKWQDSYMRWYDMLPPNAQPKVYDWAWLEFSQPNFQGPYFTGYHHLTMINPFNERRLLAQAIAMPVLERHQGQAVNSVIEAAYPPFLQIPFN